MSLNKSFLQFPESGKAYSFGAGFNGQLGHGTNHLQIEKPTVIPRIPVRTIASGKVLKLKHEI